METIREIAIKDWTEGDNPEWVNEDDSNLNWWNDDNLNLDAEN